MSSYLIGNLVGRLIMSALLVWVALLLLNRFNFGKANKKLIRPLPILSTIILFVLGLMGHASADTNKQLFWVMNFPSVGIEEIYVPAEPQWRFDVDKEEQVTTLRLTAQNKGDLASVAELSQHAFNVTEQHYPIIRSAIVERLESQYDTPLTLTNNQNNHLHSFRFESSFSTGSLLLQNQIDIFLANNRVWTFNTVVTDSGFDKFQIIRGKIFNSIQLTDTSNPPLSQLALR